MVAIERPFYLDATYELMTGSAPDSNLSRREVMIAIMLQWSKERIKTSEERGCAQMSLSAIGLDVYRSTQLPYSLEQVEDHLRELLLPWDYESKGLFRVMNDILHPQPAIRK